MSPEKTIASDGVEICTQAFGEPSDPPVLLIMGQMASMLWWPDELCERLAVAGRFVIRYDNRDTGRSTSYEPGKPPYALEDMAGDAVAVLDGYGIDRAHIVGMSLGGVIAQLVALEHPERVSSLTAVSSTKVGDPDPDLPDPTDDYMKHAAAFAELDWSDVGALTEFLVADSRQLAGAKHPFDEAAARAHATRDLGRADDPPSLQNHGMLSGGGQWTGRLGEIEAPLLVIHGTVDPIFPYPHGVALARAVPGARLVMLEGGGHELHEGDWDQILDAILSHTALRG